jgi:hypothetical protein
MTLPAYPFPVALLAFAREDAQPLQILGIGFRAEPAGSL